MPSELAKANALTKELQSRTDLGSVENNAKTSEEQEKDTATTLVDTGANQQEDFNNPQPRARISKRVQSHVITSEKQTERQAKRADVEYCLLAGVLSCTTQNPYYTASLKAGLKREVSTIGIGASKVDSTGQTSVQGLHATDVLTSQSLLSFLHKFGRRNNAGPKHLLERFLVHVSLHPAVVFENDEGDIASCVIECECFCVSFRCMPNRTLSITKV